MGRPASRRALRPPDRARHAFPSRLAWEEVNPLRRKYLTSNQTAQRLAVSPKTVARWAKQGLLPHLRTLGGHRRYDPEMVDQLRRQLTHQP
jgi:excisionase family DNA binding protein